MEYFNDAIGGKVRLSYEPGTFNSPPEHVLVICKFNNKWLLTNHSKRGLEFPGGKVEIGESLEEAARREVMEEAGAIISKLQFIGEYEVTQNETTFVKAIFYGIIDEIMKKEHYFETSGPVLVEGDILKLRWDRQYSFIMKDQVIEKSISKILEEY